MYRQILQGERETERMGEGKKKKTNLSIFHFYLSSSAWQGQASKTVCIIPNSYARKQRRTLVLSLSGAK